MRNFIILILAFVLMCSSVLAFQEVTFANVTNDNTLVRILEERLSRAGNIYTFRNGLTIDNATNNAFEWNENSEELIWTFGTDEIVLSSTTGLVAFDFASLFIEMTEISDPTGGDANVGRLYVRDNGGTTTLYFQDSADVETNLLTVGSGNTLDQAYDQGGGGVGRSITADTGAVAIANTDADTAFLLTLGANPSGSAALGGIEITLNSNSTENGIEFENTGSGDDVQGTGDTWAVTAAGALTAVSGTIPTMTVSTSLTAGSGIILDSGDTLRNSTDTEFLFTDTGGENFSIDMDAATNAIGLKSGSGVDELQLGDIDDLTGVGTIAFDVAASTITLASTGTGEDLTIQVTGATNSSLHLAAAGTAADALTVSTSAGGMDITVAGSGDGEDLDILSGRSLTLTSSEATADAIKIEASNAAGGIDIDANQDINILLTASTAGEDILIATAGTQDSHITFTADGSSENAFTVLAAVGNIDLTGGGAAGEDFDITSTNSSLNLTSGEDHIDSFVIASSGGVNIDAADDINILLTAASGDEDIIIATTGTQDNHIDIDADGSSVNALGLHASVGGVDFDSATTMDIDSAGVFTLNQAGDTLTIQVDSDGAGDDLSLIVDGDDDASIVLNSDGTAGNAIDIDVSAGGIDIDMAGGAADEDFSITTATSIDLVSTEAVAGQFKMDAQGTVVGFGIILQTTDGGIQLNADGGTNGDISIDAASVVTFTTGDSVIIDGGPIVPDIEFLTVDGTDLLTYGASDLDSNAGPMTFALGSPALGVNAIGTFKVITMSTAGNNADISVTNHETSDPEVFRFDAADEALVLMWTGTEWITIANSGVDTP